MTDFERRLTDDPLPVVVERRVEQATPAPTHKMVCRPRWRPSARCRPAPTTTWRCARRRQARKCCWLKPALVMPKPLLVDV